MEHGVVRIPKKLISEVEKIIDDNPELGYTSKVEFIKEAVRIHLKEINQKK